MKKSELKEMLKPIVEECFKEMISKDEDLVRKMVVEAIIKDGLIKQLVTEISSGAGGAVSGFAGSLGNKKEKQVFEQSHDGHKFIDRKIDPDLDNELNEAKKRLEQSLGMKGLFEGVTPADTPVEGVHGPMSHISPNDPGVDISGLIGAVGHKWKRHTK